MNFLETVIHLIVCRTGVYLSEHGYENIYDRFPRIQRMMKGLTEEDIQTWLEGNTQEARRYHQLLKIMGDDEEPDHVLESVLDLCLAQMYTPEFAAFLKFQTGSGVTLALAYGLEGIEFPYAQDVEKKIRGISAVCVADWEKSPVLYIDLSVDDRIFSFLSGSDIFFGSLPRWIHGFDHNEEIHPLYVFKDLAVKGAQYLSVPGNMIQLFGRGGRWFLAKHMACLMGKNMLMVSLEDPEFSQSGTLKRKLLALIRECLLCQGCICIRDISLKSLDRLEMSEYYFSETVVRPILGRNIPLILCTEEDLAFWDVSQEKRREGEGVSVLRMEIPLSDFNIRLKTWEGLSKLYGIKLDSEELAERFRLVPSEISKIIRIWKERFPERADMAIKTGMQEQKSSFEFSKLCYQIVCSGVEDRVGSITYPHVSMDDLKVPQSIKELLDQVIASVTGSRKIYEDWKMKNFYPYGRAVTILFTGPPGTGKTMSAHAVASALGIPLYQVNLSNVVDKYIGETEKHLEQAFTFAEKTGMILFFDEADSLFGKRSQINDAKDKYANTETSYLLQRIEQFDGIAVMATNYINNIDVAFLRRIKYVIRFQQPDEEMRLSIWKNCIHSQLPVHNLDLLYLARQFEFSGGTIKNVLLNACAIAVAQDESLKMEHILRAIKNEYIKLDRIIDPGVWAEYGYMLTN